MTLAKRCNTLAIMWRLTTSAAAAAAAAAATAASSPGLQLDVSAAATAGQVQLIEQPPSDSTMRT